MTVKRHTSWRVAEVHGFVFGMSGFTFAIVGMSDGISALSKVKTIEAKLKEAAIRPADADFD